jgi:DNA-directed RNA polymerase subunit RPC12/RpoP
MCIMAYECQNCYSKFEESETFENSLGDPQCPECGSIDVAETDPECIFDNEDVEDDGYCQDQEEYDPEELD